MHIKFHIVYKTVKTIKELDDRVVKPSEMWLAVWHLEENLQIETI